MKTVLITEFMDENAVASLATRFTVIYEPGLVDERAAMLNAVRLADALIVRNRTEVDRQVLERAVRLAVVGRLGVGLDNIDVAACKAAGVTVIPATGANALAVAEYVVCTTIMLLRGAYLATDAVRAGKWPRTALSQGREVGGKVLGIVGFGEIGRLTARMAHGLGMTVIGTDAALRDEASIWAETHVRPRRLDELLAESDVVTLHVPLSSETRHLLDARRIASMKEGAILINTARGGVVDEVALAAALKGGHIAGAAIDVFEEEPVPAKSVLGGAPNVILTPHIAGLSSESNKRVGTLIAERVAAALG